MKIYNGVVDNVFGIVVIVEIVCIFIEMYKKKLFKCFIIFVNFMVEEIGFIGFE